MKDYLKGLKKKFKRIGNHFKKFIKKLKIIKDKIIKKVKRIVFEIKLAKEYIEDRYKK